MTAKPLDSFIPLSVRAPNLEQEVIVVFKNGGGGIAQLIGENKKDKSTCTWQMMGGGSCPFEDVEKWTPHNSNYL